jgi:hypothetical protein
LSKARASLRAAPKMGCLSKSWVGLAVREGAPRAAAKYIFSILRRSPGAAIHWPIKALQNSLSAYFFHAPGAKRDPSAGAPVRCAVVSARRR